MIFRYVIAAFLFFGGVADLADTTSRYSTNIKTASFLIMLTASIMVINPKWLSE